MTFLADRVKDTSTTTGTGTITVSGTAASTFIAWGTGYATGDIVPYCIAHQSANEWEVGKGVLVTSTTITRTALGVEAGSGGSGVLVNFSAGTKDVFSPVSATMVITPGKVTALSIGNVI